MEADLDFAKTAMKKRGSAPIHKAFAQGRVICGWDPAICVGDYLLCGVIFTGGQGWKIAGRVAFINTLDLQFFYSPLRVGAQFDLTAAVYWDSNGKTATARTDEDLIWWPARGIGGGSAQGDRQDHGVVPLQGKVAASAILNPTGEARP